ncbi:heme/hemin ABC transporter substrate-binding protein [Nesterenkonia flava]|uniref:ABC transporter substrate-binding protein n=1 Tax=Nesterenkonia flava TaxID=469799 RepID=A0ABU1FU21_9MICC|nr:ABC transporter substrate-binding protein [Nesterenkonia flava]MDR5712161.1 ABC transporter substrate-binding protein [Nesterenkonia flava]
MDTHHKLLAAAAALSLLVTGCGLNSDSSPTSTDDDASSSPAANGSSEDSPGDDTQEEGSDSAAPSENWPDPADASLLTGPASAAEIPDVEPLPGEPDPQFPVTITDDRGQEVTIDSADRILALDIYGTLSDITLGLGLGDRLVGRTVSDENPSMEHLPNVTVSGHTLNAEAIMELQPDLILHDTTLGPREVLEQLESSGITVVQITPDRELDGVDDLMRDVAASLGVPERGEELVSQFETEWDEAQAYIEHLGSDTEVPPSAAVLYVRGNAGVFFIMSEDNGVNDLLGNLGLADAATEAGITGLQPANAEALADLNPDLIFVMTKGLESTGGLEGLLARPGVAQTTAGQNQRVIDAPDSQLLSFGPRSPQALTALAEAVYLEPHAADGTQ